MTFGFVLHFERVELWSSNEEGSDRPRFMANWRVIVRTDLCLTLHNRLRDSRRGERARSRNLECRIKPRKVRPTEGPISFAFKLAPPPRSLSRSLQIRTFVRRRTATKSVPGCPLSRTRSENTLIFHAT